MANTTFKLRRSSVAGKTPNTSTLSIGELAINLTDRKLFSSDGTNIFETGSNLTSLSVYSDISVGNSTVNTTINSTALSVSSIVANGSVGSGGQVLTSNGTATYWATATASVNTNAQYTWTNTHTFQSDIIFGNSTINSVANSVTFFAGVMPINTQTLTSFTIPVGTSATIAGPVTVAAGNTLTISSGSRLVVV